MQTLIQHIKKNFSPYTLARLLFPDLTWRLPIDENSVYITFDDGPIPQTTPWILDVLDKYDAKSTFFCVGENVKKYPKLFEEIIRRGHSVGNHTYNHLNGWKTDTKKYLENIELCEKIFHSTLFRPPYGKIRKNAAKILTQKYRIVMWDVLTRDYDVNRSGEECFEVVKNKTQKGSIIVFHDSVKSIDSLKYALPKTLDYIY
ncbi:MAG: polysaccharide deacetylase family protein, partial [Bacteroidales bacterium]